MIYNVCIANDVYKKAWVADGSPKVWLSSRSSLMIEEGSPLSLCGGVVHEKWPKHYTRLYLPFLDNKELYLTEDEVTCEACILLHFQQKEQSECV